MAVPAPENRNSGFRSCEQIGFACSGILNSATKNRGAVGCLDGPCACKYSTLAAMKPAARNMFSEGSKIGTVVAKDLGAGCHGERAAAEGEVDDSWARSKDDKMRASSLRRRRRVYPQPIAQPKSAFPCRKADQKETQGARGARHFFTLTEPDSPRPSPARRPKNEDQADERLDVGEAHRGRRTGQRGVIIPDTAREKPRLEKTKPKAVHIDVEK